MKRSGDKTHFCRNPNTTWRYVPLWLLAIYPNANLRSAVKWFNMARNYWPSSTTHSSRTCQSLYRGPCSNAFSRSTKNAKSFFAIFPSLLKHLLQSKDLVCDAATRTKSHWLSSSLRSPISRHFISKHLAYTLPGNSGFTCDLLKTATQNGTFIRKMVILTVGFPSVSRSIPISILIWFKSTEEWISPLDGRLIIS